MMKVTLLYACKSPLRSTLRRRSRVDRPTSNSSPNLIMRNFSYFFTLIESQNIGNKYSMQVIHEKNPFDRINSRFIRNSECKMGVKRCSKFDVNSITDSSQMKIKSVACIDRLLSQCTCCTNCVQVPGSESNAGEKIIVFTTRRAFCSLFKVAYSKKLSASERRGKTPRIVW